MSYPALLILFYKKFTGFEQPSYTLMKSFTGRMFFLLIALTPFLSACDIIEYSPNQIILKEYEKDLNRKNVSKLQSKPADDTLRIVLMGDTQRFYDEAESFVKSVNRLEGVDFVIHAGDVSDFGLSQEFEWIAKIMSGLKMPYVTVVGNHDLLANGPKVYRKMFGPLNFSFIYAGVKFIFYDANSIEYGFDGATPDLDWIEKELATGDFDWAIPVAHMPPFSIDTDLSKEEALADILGSVGKVKLSLHGHEHAFSVVDKYENGVTYVVSTTVNKKGYALITFIDGEFTVEEINY